MASIAPIQRTQSRGFSLIEMIVVVTVIGLMAALVLVSLGNARKRARDTKRRADLHTIALAMEIYYDSHGTYQIPRSGWMQNGHGWFNCSSADHANYPGLSIAQALKDAGALAEIVSDPIAPPCNGYMLYICDSDGVNYHRFAVSATLEDPTADDIAYIQTTCNGNHPTNGTYTHYGKNFAVEN